MAQKPLYYMRYYSMGITRSWNKKHGGKLIEYPNNQPVWWAWEALLSHTKELWHG